MCLAYVLCQLVHAPSFRFHSSWHIHVRCMLGDSGQHSSPSLLFVPLSSPHSFPLPSPFPLFFNPSKVPYCATYARLRHCIVLCNLNRKFFPLCPVGHLLYCLSISIECCFPRMLLVSTNCCFHLSCRADSSMPINPNIMCFPLSPAGHLLQRLSTSTESVSLCCRASSSMPTLWHTWCPPSCVTPLWATWKKKR